MVPTVVSVAVADLLKTKVGLRREPTLHSLALVVVVVF